MQMPSAAVPFWPPTIQPHQSSSAWTQHERFGGDLQGGVVGCWLLLTACLFDDWPLFCWVFAFSFPGHADTATANDFSIILQHVCYIRAQPYNYACMH